MSNWKEVLTQSIATQQDARRASITNEQACLSEYDALLLRASHPQAGMVHYSNVEHTYSVSNEHTFGVHSDLALEEVEQAMHDLDVADSVWYRW